MRLFPELATCHDVSIPELLASRDERQQDSAFANTPRHSTGLLYRGGARPDERQRVNPPDL